MFMPKNEGADFAPPPAGTHVAVCYRLIDLGTQKTEYQGETKTQRKIMLSWELADELMEDGRPFTVSKRYTLSSHEKSTLRAHLEAWRGKAFTEAELDPTNPAGFNIKNILGKGCLLSVVHNTKDGKTYANVGSLSKLIKGQVAPAPKNELVYFSLDDFDAATFDKLSDGLKQTIAASPEYLRRGAPQSSASGGDQGYDLDDREPLPF